MKEQITTFGTYDPIVEDLNALEQAIVDICSPDMVRTIHERKRMIRKK